MGTCFSKKKISSPPPPPATGYGDVVVGSNNKKKPQSESEAAEPGELKMKAKTTPGGKQEQIGGGEEEEEEEKQENQETQVQVKKEIFIIKHRKSHDGRGDRDCKKSPVPQIQQNLPQQEPSDGDSASPTEMSKGCNEAVDEIDKVGKRVRTQSCNKEELDAILIQCGRLSRCNSSGSGNRKYSGSKRSYDFDANSKTTDINVDDISHDGADADGEGVAADTERTHHRRQSSRHSSPSSQGRRRRTPSRERNQQQRSSSRERRTSRSPARRGSSSSQQNSISSSSLNANGSANVNSNANQRPGKMVSVPAAAISSLPMVDKNSNNNNGESAASVKRVLVKRNVGSPRSQSPARANARASNDGQQQQQPSLSRSSSRKADQSPYRRNPLAEIDPNSLAYPVPPQVHNKNSNTNKGETQAKEGPTSLLNQAPMQKPTLETNNSRTVVPQGINYITSSTSTMDSNKVMSANCSSKERQQNILVEEAKGQQPPGKPQTLTRSRSSRRSRDLDIDPETNTLSNPASSLYTSLLLQDIHNFHQQSATTTNVVSLPPCVTKAHSILEAVADLNSATKDQTNKKATPGYNCSLSAANSILGGKSVADGPKDPFVESEVVVNDDIMEPSFHKYVTVRRGTGALEGGLLDMEDQESSGSNSFVSGSSRSQQHHWGFSSSSWEPNSADSTDCWTSRSNTREEDHKTPLSFDLDETTRRRLSGKKREGNDHHQRSGGIGRGKLAATNTKGLCTIPGVAAAASM